MKITPIDGNIETEGAECSYRGITLIVARSGNTNFKKVFRELMKPHEDDFDAGRLDVDKSNEIMLTCIAKTILIGWKNLVDATGKKWEYSEKNAISLLTDDEDCYDAVMKFSKNIDNYLANSQEGLKVK